MICELCKFSDSAYHQMRFLNLKLELYNMKVNGNVHANN